MDYLVIKDFIERVTLKQYKAGDKYTCLDTERASFLIRTGYLAKPTEKEVEKPKKTTAKATTTKRSPKAKKA